jgi:adenylosuccinate synthase
MQTKIVIGLGFGDEGKGVITSSLAANSENPLVIRHNGGHQAGHTVVREDGVRHVFSNYGAGSLHGVPTYWSRFCTIDPIGMENEYDLLVSKGVVPKLYIAPDCPVTLPFDKEWNVHMDKIKKHGTVGVGFGTTLERHERRYKITARDLHYPEVLKQKLYLVLDHYYQNWYNGKIIANEWIERVTTLVNADRLRIAKLDDVIDTHAIETVIFEGAQGIMLDQDYGFFPHVTRSKTTSVNALQIIKERKWKTTPTIYYVTRAYQTRHGNGPMTNEDKKLKLRNNEKETNVKGIQGDFRVAFLDIDLLRYALSCDSFPRKNANSKFVITCLDQIEGKVPCTMGGTSILRTPLEIANKLGFTNVTKILSPITREI